MCACVSDDSSGDSDEEERISHFAADANNVPWRSVSDRSSDVADGEYEFLSDDSSEEATPSS